MYERCDVVSNSCSTTGTNFDLFRISNVRSTASFVAQLFELWCPRRTMPTLRSSSVLSLSLSLVSLVQQFVDGVLVDFHKCNKDRVGAILIRLRIPQRCIVQCPSRCRLHHSKTIKCLLSPTPIGKEEQDCTRISDDSCHCRLRRVSTHL